MTTRVRWALVAAAVAVIAVVVFLLFRGEDDPAEPSASGTTASATPSSSASPGEPDATASEPSTKKTTSAGADEGEPRVVGLDDEATIDRGASARIVKIESVTSKAKGPGEVSGPAIRVTFEVDAGSKPVDVSDVSVNAYYGADLTPSIPMTQPGSDPFSGTVAAGKTARGVYVFNVPKKQRSDVTVEMYYAADRPAVRFHGAV